MKVKIFRVRESEHIANRKLMGVFKMMYEEMVITEGEMGGCDHSVGICQCGFNRVVRDAKEILDSYFKEVGDNET